MRKATMHIILFIDDFLNNWIYKIAKVWKHVFYLIDKEFSGWLVEGLVRPKVVMAESELFAGGVGPQTLNPKTTKTHKCNACLFNA